jgi:hypothetical protein
MYIKHYFKYYFNSSLIIPSGLSSINVIENYSSFNTVKLPTI